MSHTRSNTGRRGLSTAALRPCEAYEGRPVRHTLCSVVRGIAYTVALLPVVVPALALIGATLAIERICVGRGRLIWVWLLLLDPEVLCDARVTTMRG